MPTIRKVLSTPPRSMTMNDNNTIILPESPSRLLRSTPSRISRALPEGASVSSPMTRAAIKSMTNMMDDGNNNKSISRIVTLNNNDDSMPSSLPQPNTMSMKSMPTMTMTTMTPSRMPLPRITSNTTSTSVAVTTTAGMNLVQLYSPVKAARTVLERKRRRRAAAAYEDEEDDDDEEEMGDNDVKSNAMTATVKVENLRSGMTPPTMTPMAMPTSSLETSSTTITPARKKLSLRPTNHITPTNATSAVSATSTIPPNGSNSSSSSVSKTWRIKIGSPTSSSSHSFKEKITPPVEWMCHTCCSGGNIPSLADACDNCRRKGYSHRSSSQQLVNHQHQHNQQHQHHQQGQLHLPTNMASTVTPTRCGGVMISGVSPHRIAAGGGGGGGGGEEAYEMDVLDGDFDWNENEIDRAQMWQREHQQLEESGGEENEVVNAATISTTNTTATVATTSTPPAQKKWVDISGSSTDNIKTMVFVKKEVDSSGASMNLSKSSGSSKSSTITKKKRTKKQRLPNNLPRSSTKLPQQQLNQYPIVHTDAKTTVKMEHSPSNNQLLSIKNNKGNKHGHNTIQNTSQPFILYDTNDDDHINAVHNIVRRDIWEGFVVGSSGEPTMLHTTPVINGDSTNTEEDSAGADAGVAGTNAAAGSTTTTTAADATADVNRSSSRLERYAGTIGFRCRFCKCAPASERAEKSAVYPRSLERIYLSNIRFQRDHIL